MAGRAHSKETVVIAGASHVVMVSNPEAVAALIERRGSEIAGPVRDVYSQVNRSVRTRDRQMHIAIVTFEGFNELDSLIALGVLNRISRPDWRVTLCCPQASVTSMNGVVVQAQSQLHEASAADVVLVGSGKMTREIANDPEILSALRLDPSRQLVGAQCSGALVLAKLRLLAGIPACTDLKTKPWVQEAGVEVLDQPFFASGNVATAGGCLSSQYLAAWVIARTEGLEAARAALDYVAPVGEKEDYVERAMRNIAPYLEAPSNSFNPTSVRGSA